MLKQLNHPQSSTVFIKQFGWRFKQIRITVNIATPYNRKKFGSKIKFTKSMIDDLNQPVCYPVTSIMNGLAIFKKSKFGHEFIFLTQYESTFILVTLPKKDPGEEDF